MAEKTSEFKIVIVGGSGVGKSSVINSFCGNIVEEDLEGKIIPKKKDFFFNIAVLIVGKISRWQTSLGIVQDKPLRLMVNSMMKMKKQCKIWS